MAIFSPKARRLVETAVSQLTDDVQRQIWDTWARANPDVRRAGDAAPGCQELPNGPAAIAPGALERLSATLSKSILTDTLTEDEICDIEGDIGLVNVVKSMLIESLHASQVAA
jgi:hypothetical protein